MRINQPVFNNETEVPEGEFIYSTTDLKGKITSANELFVKLSGFSHDELVGQPHNIVRHPDMPPEAFADMWHHLKNGRPWSGLVKNRRKDGGYYWVQAFASPMRENGQVVGYESVRRRAQRQDIAKAEKGYADVRKGRRYRIENGKLLRKGITGRLSTLSLVAKLRGETALAAALGLIIYLMGARDIGAGWAVLPLLALLVVLGHLGGVFAASLRRDLGILRDTLSEIQRDGDLRRVTRLSRIDEIGAIGDALNALLANLQAVLISAQQTVHETLTQSQGIADSSGSVATATRATSDAAQSTAAAVEELTVSVTEVANNVALAATSTRRSNEAALVGISAAQATELEIQSLAEEVREAAQTMTKLESSSTQIGNIAAVIAEIADQTNLLALNAAIEAARAGEQGRGFAVVADEVRKLAERTVNATNDIRQIVESLGKETQAAVSRVRRSDERCTSGVERVRATRSSLETITTALDESTTLVADIETATHEQAVAATEIAGNVERIARMSEQGAESVAQINQSSDTLAAVSRTLEARLGRVRI